MSIRDLTEKDLNPHDYPLTSEIAANLEELAVRLNKAQAAYGKQFIVTSGLRSNAQQQALIVSGKSDAQHSKHLTGQAADIYDPDGELKAWILLNLPTVEEIGFWFEAFASTPNWVHFQIVPPGSGERFFIP